MGSFGELIDNTTVFGLLPNNKDKVSSRAAADVTEEQKQTKKTRAQIIATEGGVGGEEILSGKVTKGRNTLFGN